MGKTGRFFFAEFEKNLRKKKIFFEIPSFFSNVRKSGIFFASREKINTAPTPKNERKKQRETRRKKEDLRKNEKRA